ncbi:hypothetical protein CSUB01_08324 [Colletotrichum sublineola]|uniref:Chromo domain-containing protein n=1 Tax=Colletotrichum sublineola TaxID=1173701 RepID=A0A066XNB4_COLSU|nr:hypothetical protein CSUB01_08324 [Colletotrichum sublineola]
MSFPNELLSLRSNQRRQDGFERRDTPRELADGTAELPELDLEDDIWEVEEVVAHQGSGDDLSYLVKWAGWPAEYNTWEPLDHLEDAKEAVRKYERQRKRVHKKWDE